MQLNLKNPLVFFDLETTGTNIISDRIVEICYLKVFPNGNETAKTMRINPEMHIPEESTAIHGIHDEDVAGCPTFKEVAKELNLSQEKAQGVLDKMAPILAQRQIENIQAVSKQWEERSRADKELSADWNRSMAAIARVRDRFSRGPDGTVDADIDEFLRLPIGNHPGCLKLLARAGHAIGEAGFPRGSAAGDGKVSPEAFYKSAKK